MCVGRGRAVVVDLFAGAGGWDIGAAAAGVTTVGIESWGRACETRAAAGLPTIRADLTTYQAPLGATVEGLIASPPCQAWSQAGNREASGHAEALQRLVAYTPTGRIADDAHAYAMSHDLPDLWLAVVPLVWALRHRPRWVAFEQVPAVLPLWRTAAHALEREGWSCWTGVLNAADYGVPQTRQRALLLARVDQPAVPPPATHDRDPRAGLFGDALEPWVSMSDALGWPSHADEFVAASTRSATVRNGSQPASTILANAAKQGGWKPGGGRDDAQAVEIDDPSPTITAKASGQWWWTRPATTVQGDTRIWPPGHKINADDRRRLGDHAAERYGDRAGTNAIKVTLDELAALQTFPPGYPFRGNKNERSTQIGNAVPPLLAHCIIRHLAGSAS